MGELGNVYSIFVAKLEGKRPLGRSTHKLGDTIRMDVREIGWEGVDWIHVAQDRDQWWGVVNTVMNLRGFHKRSGVS
jgi:hypothetical protein